MVAESEALHLLARHTPISIEVQHHRSSVRLSDTSIELSQRPDALKFWLAFHLRSSGARSQSSQWLQNVASAGKSPRQQRNANQQRDDAHPFPQPLHTRRIVRK